VTEDDDLRFEAPDPNQVGDTLRIFIKARPGR
jgi:hypothetical protein